MHATPSRKRATAVKPVHLRFDIFDAKCAARNARSYAERAALFELDPKTIWRLCHHEAEATISTAMHISRRLHSDVDALFSIDAKSARDLVKPKVA